MDVEGWLTLAQRDLDAATVLAGSGKRLAVGFHCQQALEKLLKGRYLLVRGTMPPRTHDLARLAAEVADDDDRWNTEREFLAELADLCVRSRYLHPDWKATLAYLERDDVAERLLARTREIDAWLRSKLP